MNPTAGDTQNGSKAVSRWVFTGILLLAALLRFYRLDLISVTNATAFQELTAASALSFDGWDWPLAGPPTEEVRSSAFLVSAIAIADSIVRHPFTGTVFVILLNLCAVALLFRLCLRQFGFHAAWIAMLLCAVSPWGVFYSRLLLPSSCLAVFSVLLIHFSLRWLNEKGTIRLAMIVLVGLVIPQIHFSGICMLPWLFAVLYLGRKQVSFRGLFSGVILGAILWIPWIAYQKLTGWVELKTWAGEIFQSPAEHGRAALQSINHLQSMLHSANFDYWFGGSLSEWPGYFPSWLRWALGLSAVLLLVVLLISIAWILTRGTDRANRLLLFWIALPVLFGALLRTGLSPENILIAWPVPFVLLSAMTVRLWEMLPRRLCCIPIAVVIVVSMMHVVFLARCAQFVADGNTGARGRYELSYRQRQAAVQSVLEDADGDPVRLVGPFSGWYPAYGYVLLYEQRSPARMLKQRDELVCYWIDEQPPDDILSESAWKNRKERQVNLSIAEYLRTPPDWVIDRHWSVGPSQIYRLRFVKKQPLQ